MFCYFQDNQDNPYISYGVGQQMEKEFDFYQDHSRNYLEMALRTDRIGTLEHPDGYGKRTGDCQDTVEMFITIKGDVIQTVSYVTDGCLNTNACANTVAHLAEGKTLSEAWEITPEDVIQFLETLPEGHYHCAELAIGAFYLALANVQETLQSPWKKLYR